MTTGMQILRFLAAPGVVYICAVGKAFGIGNTFANQEGKGHKITDLHVKPSTKPVSRRMSRLYNLAVIPGELWIHAACFIMDAQFTQTYHHIHIKKEKPHE